VAVHRVKRSGNMDARDFTYTCLVIVDIAIFRSCIQDREIGSTIVVKQAC
jgi:hypothetical protein